MSDRDHPIMDGIDPYGIIWGTGKKTKIPGEPLLMVGDIPVITLFEDFSGNHKIFIRFDPGAVHSPENCFVARAHMEYNKLQDIFYAGA